MMKNIKYRDNEGLLKAVGSDLTPMEIGKIWKYAAFNCDENREVELTIEDRVTINVVNCQNEDEYLKERTERQQRKRHIEAIRMRRDYLAEKMDDQGISNSFMIRERKALDFVLEKFKEGII